MDLDKIFDQVARETGITITRFRQPLFSHGPIPRIYAEGDWTWENIGLGHIEIVRWRDRNQHWQKTAIPVEMALEQHGEEGLMRVLIAAVRYLAKLGTDEREK